MILSHYEAQKRRRRIILNDDAGSLHQETADTLEGFLSDRLAYVVDSQVDSIWWSIMMSAEGYLYDTQVGEIPGREPYLGGLEGDAERFALIWRNVKSCLDAGTDPLREVIKFGHAHGKEVFASFRMNMIQDSWRPNFITKWKREHPEYCLGRRGMYESCPDNDHRKLYWSAFNYAHQAVRDQRVAVIDEVCTRYDVDGMELDFWRWPMLFMPSLDNKPVEPKHIEIMNDFIRRIRKRMLEIETERKRPLLLAPRVFDTLELNLKMGLDVQTWLDEGLIDLLVVGGTYNEYAIPVADWSELARKYDVPLYPCLYRSKGLDGDRAIAAYYHSSGADGIYTFNFRFPKDAPSIVEIGDPELIARKDKHYRMSHTITMPAFRHVCAPGLLPVRLEQDKERYATLVIGDDIEAAACPCPSADEALAELKLRLSLKNFVYEQDVVAFRLNGKTLSSPQRTETEGNLCHMEFIEPPLTRNRNIIEMVLGRRQSGLTGSVELVGTELWVRYK